MQERREHTKIMLMCELQNLLLVPGFWKDRKELGIASDWEEYHDCCCSSMGVFGLRADQICSLISVT